MEKKDVILPIDLNKIDASTYKMRCVGCIVLTKDHKILLQQRGENWDSFPGYLATFGGHIESGETPMQTLIRELQEELGATVKDSDLVTLGAFTEAITNHTELIYAYFWHDKHDTITGCYEGEARYFDSLADVLKHPKVMDDVVWMLEQCQKQVLLK